MKLFKKIATFVVTICTLFAFVATANKTNAASYVETSFGEGQILITTTFNGSTYYLPATTTSSGPSAKSFTDVSEISEEHLWTVSTNGSNYYIQNSEGMYLYTTNTNNGVRVGSTANAWTYDSATNSFKDTVTSRYLGIYNASNWRCYTTVNQSNYKESSTSFKFYKVNATAPSVSVEGDAYTEVDGVVQFSAVLANISGSVNWSSSNESVATIDQFGNVTTLSVGKTIITADVNGTQGTYELTVYPKDGSELSIAEALQVCELTGQSEAPFVYSTTGVVESIDEAYNADYTNITVTITDGTNSIKAYRMSGGEELVEGTKIKVTGTLIYFGNHTPEFIAGSTYVEVQDTDIVANVKEKLNQVSAYMSLSFKYTQYEEEVNALSSATMQYTAGTTTNMVADANNAATVGLDENLFNVSASKGSASNNVGLNKSGQIRLYAHSSSGNGNELTISTLNNDTISSIEVTFGGTVSNITVNGSSYTPTANAENVEYEVNSNSVTIKNVTSGSSTQVYILSIVINLDGSGSSTTVTKYKDDEFRFRFGVDKALADIEGVDSYGIQVTANGQTKNYDLTVDQDYYGEDNNYHYVVVSLGQAINENRLNVEFEVAAYVVLDGVTYCSTSVKTHSVSSIVEEYLSLELSDSDMAAVKALAAVLGIETE